MCFWGGPGEEAATLQTANTGSRIPSGPHISGPDLNIMARSWPLKRKLSIPHILNRFAAIRDKLSGFGRAALLNDHPMAEHTADKQEAWLMAAATSTNAPWRCDCYCWGTQPSGLVKAAAGEERGRVQVTSGEGETVGGDHREMNRDREDSVLTHLSILSRSLGSCWHLWVRSLRRPFSQVSEQCLLGS